MTATATRTRSPRRAQSTAALFERKITPGAQEIDVDYFAGGGGVSMGHQMATGKAMDLAVNHCPLAIAMHAANHPETRHLTEDVWKVDLEDERQGRPIRLLWGSPDCRHFSRAKGGKPVEKKIRGLAWALVFAAAKALPRMLILENVREFQDWGPLTKEGRPCPRRRGRTFKAFVNKIRRLGYLVEWRVLNAADYGAPTHRHRLVLICRRDRSPLWPVATHGDPKSLAVKGGLLLPWHTAAECLDWSIPCPSIFDRKRPLARKTEARIAMGIVRYVLGTPEPYIVKVNHGGPDEFRGQSIHKPLSTVTGKHGWGLVSPSIINIERSYKDFAGQPADQPLGTITAQPKGGKHALVQADIAPLITQYNSSKGGESRCNPADRPLNTLTAEPRYGMVAPHIVKFRGNSEGAPVDAPLPTITGGAGAARPAGAAHAMGVAAADLAPLMLSGYGERPGQEPRSSAVTEPLHSVVASPKHRVVAAELMATSHVLRSAGHELAANKARGSASFIAKHFGGVVGHDLDRPIGAVTGKDHHSLVTATTIGVGGRAGQSPPTGIDEPLRTITGKADRAVVSGVLIGTGGAVYAAKPRPVDEPKNVVMTNDRSALAAASMVRMNFGDKQWNSVEEPLPTVTAQGNKSGLVIAFLQKYYGSGGQWQRADEPLHTTTDRARFAAVQIAVDEEDIVGVVRVGRFMLRHAGAKDPYAVAPESSRELRDKLALCRRKTKPRCFTPTWMRIGSAALPVALAHVQGEPRLVAGIGMRMLVPRELARCQSFPDSYILTGSTASQVARIGNSVPPKLAEAVIRANVTPSAAVA